MITYEGVFAFVLVLVSVATLFYNIGKTNGKRK